MAGEITAMAIGVVLGAGITLVAVWIRQRSHQAGIDRLLADAEQRHQHELEALIERIRAMFGDLSRQALSTNSEEFLRLAQTRFDAQKQAGEASLDSRKKLIDETVKQIQTRLAEVSSALTTQEKDRRQSYGELIQRLDNATKVTTSLQQTTAQLREALANPQRRGQWGERMAEDVLRLAGFVEGINYEKQATQQSGSRPDFTFPLPPDRRLHMDVKFPLPNYLKYLDAETAGERDQARTAFIRDVRQRIKEVTSREYIDPDGGTLDYVLVFIPNEQVYSFMHEHAPDLMDEALAQKVVLCAPLTLYAIVSVVRQASRNFRMEEASREILSLLAAFNKEWGRFTEQMDKVERNLEQTVAGFEQLAGVRQRKLEAQLGKIEALTTHERIALPDADGG